jgi:sirohydrochlorin cobaltochelatase
MKRDSITSSLGVLLVGHGTRDRRGQAEFLQAAAMLQELLSEAAVEPCFLELAAPDISAGVARLASRAGRRWVVAPALLFAAAHAKRDIPELVAQAIRQQSLRSIDWAMAEPLACHELLLELSAKRFRDVLPSDATPQETQLIMVGRGTSHAEAIADMRRFTELRAKRTPIAGHQTAFLTAATPSLGDALQCAADSAQANIIVQPHLLWRGQLVDDITAAVASVRETAAGRRKRWAVAEHLGPQPEVVAALGERIQGCYTTISQPDA